MTVEQVLDAVLALSVDDRVELVEAILASLQPEDRPPFDEAWREVIARRAAELRDGHVTAVPWAEVKRQAREKAGG